MDRSEAAISTTQIGNDTAANIRHGSLEKMSFCPLVVSPPPTLQFLAAAGVPNPSTFAVLRKLVFSRGSYAARRHRF